MARLSKGKFGSTPQFNAAAAAAQQQQQQQLLLLQQQQQQPLGVGPFVPPPPSSFSCHEVANAAATLGPHHPTTRNSRYEIRTRN